MHRRHRHTAVVELLHRNQRALHFKETIETPGEGPRGINPFPDESPRATCLRKVVHVLSGILQLRALLATGGAAG